MQYGQMPYFNFFCDFEFNWILKATANFVYTRLDGMLLEWKLK